MDSQSFTLSSSGLQNLVINSDSDENEFKFISPIVSNLHKTDQTINYICIKDFNSNELNFNSNSKDEFFDDELDSLFQKIAHGFHTEISKEQSFKIQILSFLIGNEELFSKINEIHQIEINESNLNEYLKNLEFIFNISQKSQRFNYQSIIDFISSHFYLINKNDLLKIPKTILYTIISNPNLKIDSEDSLFELIQKIFYFESSQNGINDISIISFYEEIDFLNLSESKFIEFLNEFDFNEMTNSLWTNLCRCFYVNYDPKQCKKHIERYLYEGELFEYDGNEMNRFKGIIHHLTEKTGGNVNDNKTVIVTASSSFSNRYAKYAVDLDDKYHYFQSQAHPNSWIKYDFGDMKVRPNKYSIRSRHDCGQGGYHLKNWVIEVSETDNDDDWKVIDSRSDVMSLDDQNAVQTFDINEKLGENDFYRFLRLRQTGVNTGNNFTLPLSALEYFGYLKA